MADIDPSVVQGAVPLGSLTASQGSTISLGGIDVCPGRVLLVVSARDGGLPGVGAAVSLGDIPGYKVYSLYVGSLLVETWAFESDLPISDATLAITYPNLPNAAAFMVQIGPPSRPPWTPPALTWEPDPLTVPSSGITGMVSYSAALAYAAAKGPGWRLPTIEELSAAMLAGVEAGTNGGFTAGATGFYWSMTTVGADKLTCSVQTDTPGTIGSSGQATTGGAANVRCVQLLL